ALSTAYLPGSGASLGPRTIHRRFAWSCESPLRDEAGLKRLREYGSPNSGGTHVQVRPCPHHRAHRLRPRFRHRPDQRHAGHHLRRQPWPAWRLGPRLRPPPQPAPDSPGALTDGGRPRGLSARPSRTQDTARQRPSLQTPSRHRKPSEGRIVLDPESLPPLHELGFQYQPIVSLGEAEPLWAEALVRWRLPDGTVRGPLAILPHWL